MLEKTLAAVAGLVALSAAMIVAVIGAAFALYFILEAPLGRAGACAIVAAVFGLIVAAAALFVASRGHHHKEEEEEAASGDFGLIAKIFEIAREKPLLSVGAAIAAGVIAIRNPALVATIVAAFLGKGRDRD